MAWHFALDVNALRNAERAGIARSMCNEDRNRARSLILREMHDMAVAEQEVDDIGARRIADRIQLLATDLRNHLEEHGI